MSDLYFRAKMLSITGEPRDLTLHIRTESTKLNVAITSTMIDYLAEEILAIRKKQKEPVA